MIEKAQIHVALMGRCDDCFGIGLRNRFMPKTPENTCKRCNGTGDVFEPVYCAGCNWFNEGRYCAKLDLYNIGPDFGCPLWQPKA